MAGKRGARKRSNTTNRMVVRRIANWHEFSEVVAGSDYQNWAFRGQSDAKWPLFSSLSRYLKGYGIHRQAWADQEERIGRIFRRKAHLFLDHVPDETDAFQWLALMQHHGAPTRLLDFTWSPFVAAFFALERATEDSAVWAVFVPTMWRAAHAINFPAKQTPLTPNQLSLRTVGAYEDFYLRNDVAFVSSGEPLVMNKRLIAQSGTFVVPGVLDQPVETILATYPEPGKTVVKFVLATRAIRDDAMRAFYNMNLTNATLFPDLDGLARSLAYELEFHWAYNPKTMKINPGYESS
ncbi:MAG TPA: FRG domain-containing protein [Gemmatimonadaceae bacterium]|nr:FRG domain-containing protein [Gemmatimonadaceae bacterium]